VKREVLEDQARLQQEEIDKQRETRSSKAASNGRKRAAGKERQDASGSRREPPAHRRGGAQAHGRRGSAPRRGNPGPRGGRRERKAAAAKPARRCARSSTTRRRATAGRAAYRRRRQFAAQEKEVARWTAPFCRRRQRYQHGFEMPTARVVRESPFPRPSRGRARAEDAVKAPKSSRS